MEAIETIERDGLTVKLFFDPEPTSPDDWDQLATFQHSASFTFGEPIGEPERGWDVHIRALTLMGEAAATVPVRVDDYGSRGLMIYESDAENANGVLFTTHERVTELCTDKPEYHERTWIEQALRGELEQWKQYAENDVYGYVIENESGEHVDSCWGFYGFEYAKEQAAEALDTAVTDAKTRQQEVARGWAIAHGLTPRT